MSPWTCPGLIQAAPPDEWPDVGGAAGRRLVDLESMVVANGKRSTSGVGTQHVAALPLPGLLSAHEEPSPPESKPVHAPHDETGR